jgi:large subunit ribosomal protein L23
MNTYDIIRKPLNTEKTNVQQELYNMVSFEVSKTANRIQIKDSIEEIFKVKVESVRTMRVKGKRTQRGRITGKKKDWKKAIVKLMPGEKIDFFEGV